MPQSTLDTFLDAGVRRPPAVGAHEAVVDARKEMVLNAARILARQARPAGQVARPRRCRHNRRRPGATRPP